MNVLIHLLVLILSGPPPLELTNPPPLMIGFAIEKQPLVFRVNRIPDQGWHEYWPAFTPARRGEVSFDGSVLVPSRIDADDIKWCGFCWRGPDVPHARHIRLVESGSVLPIACYLCDLDDDGDVDLRDHATHLTLLEG